MHWALVLYSLTLLYGDGRPMVSSFHPENGEVECVAHQERARDELKRAGYVGVCQQFQVGHTPVWPWRADWRPYHPGTRLTGR